MDPQAISWSAKRKDVRALLQPFARRSYRSSLPLVVLDLALFAAASGAVVAWASPAAKFAAAIVLAVAMSRLFVLGHDACHQALTPSRRLNAILGRLVFLPTLTCYSLWQAGHNIAHHGFAGLRGKDIPWVPLAPERYLALPRARRALYRAYRSWWGAGLYYGIDIWWKQQIFPRGKVRAVFMWDSWLVTAFLAAQVAAYVAAARATDQSALLLLAFGVVLPYVVWLYLAGIVFYLHHTDETAHWYDDEPAWRAAQPNLDGTHGAHLPLRFDLLLHHAAEHTAHHVNPGIPCYRLAAAQRALEARYPADVPLRRVTLRRYVEITRRCQLYDSARHQWLTFAEVETAPAVIGA